MRNSLIFFLFFAFFTSLITFTILSLIPKKVFLLASLEVYQIENVVEKNQEQKKCLVSLNWQNQPLSSVAATKEIQQISGLQDEFSLDLKNYQLIPKNSYQIIVSNFNNHCQWFFKPVLIRIANTTLLDYLFDQLFNF